MATFNIRVMTWNVDGLNGVFLEKRTTAAVECIVKENPDLILLQEVVVETINAFTTYICQLGYNVSSLEHTFLGMSYFTLTFVRSTFQLEKGYIADYNDKGTSQMGRNMNIAIILAYGVRIMIVNTHLESCKESADIRVCQLEQALTLISNHDGPAMLCGDLNIRDAEVNKTKENLTQTIGINAVSKISDAWEAAGRNKSQETTWTLYNNPNILKRVYRFDRIYYNSKADILIKKYCLVGIETLPAPVHTPASDHFGILTEFSIQGINEKNIVNLNSSSMSTSNQVQSLASSSEKQIKSNNDTNAELQTSNTVGGILYYVLLIY